MAALTTGSDGPRGHGGAVHIGADESALRERGMRGTPQRICRHAMSSTTIHSSAGIGREEACAAGARERAVAPNGSRRHHDADSCLSAREMKLL